MTFLPCRAATFLELSSVLPSLRQQQLNVPHIHGKTPTMARRPSLLTQPTFRPPYYPKTASISKKSLAYCCITVGPSIQPFWSPSALLLQPKHKTLKPQPRLVRISSTIARPILMQSSATLPATWSFMFTVINASYLSKPKACSQVGSLNYLSSRPRDPQQPLSPNDPPPPLNGAVLVVSNIMKQVLGSASSEAETGGLFYNGQEATTIRANPTRNGIPSTTHSAPNGHHDRCWYRQLHRQATPFQIHRHALYWICDRVSQGQFLVHWKRSAHADYFTTSITLLLIIIASGISLPSKDYYISYSDIL